MKKTDWISVKVDTPDYNERVLLLRPVTFSPDEKSTVQNIGIRTHTDSSGEHYSYEHSSCGVGYSTNPTHWMPLPEPPKQ